MSFGALAYNITPVSIKQTISRKTKVLAHRKPENQPLTYTKHHYRNLKFEITMTAGARGLLFL